MLTFTGGEGSHRQGFPRPSPEFLIIGDFLYSGNHILPLGDIDQAVVQPAEEKGAVARAADGGHWNEVGHRLVGEAIATAFRKECLLNLCQSAAESGRR